MDVNENSDGVISLFIGMVVNLLHLTWIVVIYGIAFVFLLACIIGFVIFVLFIGACAAGIIAIDRAFNVLTGGSDG